MPCYVTTSRFRLEPGAKPKFHQVSDRPAQVDGEIEVKRWPVAYTVVGASALCVAFYAALGFLLGWLS